MRKVKYAQQTVHDRLTRILDQFPVLDDLHPFYADLLNVLYDKDHYKLALGQLATARRLIDNLSQEHVRFLKYGDSLYRCKQLKRAALGRMCRIIKHLSASLAYLEQVRQHLGRLPSIDPASRTLICTGFPNVGKSSLLRVLTDANVDVQPYAFTTKSIFVGHVEYEHLRWQVLDTPGLLDHPLEQRNTIEMQAVTALAHLRAAVLFVLDISETCGYSIKQQLALFESIRPLFAAKPLVVALNKIDIVREDQLPAADRALLDGLRAQGVLLVPMSTLTAEGVHDVQRAACDSLLAQRTEEKLSGARAQSILQRLHMAVPQQRDDMQRLPCVPASVYAARAEKAAADAAAAASGGDGEARKRELTPAEIEIEQERRDLAMLERGENPWSTWLRDRDGYILEKDEWKTDIIPEIMDGMNIADFVDPAILERLEELEREEESQIAQAAAEGVFDDSDDEDKALEAVAQEYHGMRMLQTVSNRSATQGSSHLIARKVAATRKPEDLQKYLMGLGVDPAMAAEAAKSAAAKAGTTAVVRKRGRELARKRMREDDMEDEDYDEKEEEEEEEEEVKPLPRKKLREMSRSRSRSRSASVGRPLAPSAMAKLAERATSITGDAAKERAKRLQRASPARIRSAARKGERDRHIYNLMPKHLFSGKRKGGKHDRR